MKTSISPQIIEAFLVQYYADSYQSASLKQLTEGLESQAFKFVADRKILVLRLNQSDYGFQKDWLWYKSSVICLSLKLLTSDNSMTLLFTA